jgi:hypothetical protein
MNIDTISDFRKAVRHGAYAWPGGYPTFFICADAGALCHACAKKERRSIIHSIKDDYGDGWRVVAMDVNWEDPELFCAHCNERIESAYAEDKAND